MAAGACAWNMLQEKISFIHQTDSACGDRSPRSPEATRTPSGRQPRGRFVFGVRKGIHESTNVYGVRFALKHPAATSRGRGAAATGTCALRPDASARAVRETDSRNGTSEAKVAARLSTRIAGWRQPAIRSIEPTGSRGMGSSPIRCARTCR